MDNRLAQDFNAIRLIKFTLPTMVMLVFMSLYQMVDGIFVANFVGSDALAALNITYPLPSILIAFSIMLATGGSAIIAKNMGEGKTEEAKENFSMIILAGFILGIVFTVVGILFLKQIILLLGATPRLYQDCYDYLWILTLISPLIVFQMLFQIFFVTAGRPNLGLTLTVIGGIMNIVFDYIFIVIFHMGVTGAAIGTSMASAFPAIVGLIYFTFNRKGTLYLVKPVFRKRVLLHTCINGSSEMVNNIAASIITFLFNILMLKYAGEAGVAAITVVLYAQFLMTSVFMGFSSGIAPVISYNYGSQNHVQLQKLFKMSMWIIILISVIVFILSEGGAPIIVGVFAAPESEVYSLAIHGFILFSTSFLVTGINIFASGMFTAFSNGKVSAIISFLRTFLFLVVCLIGLPMLMEIDGIWIAVPVAEVLALIVSLHYFVKYRNTYHYLKTR